MTRLFHDLCGNLALVRIVCERSGCSGGVPAGVDDARANKATTRRTC